MSYNNSPPDHHQDVFHYGYPTHNYHYISDGGSTAGGDDTNFWSHSPSRSDSPSPNTLQGAIGGTYQIYAQVGCSTPNRYTPYRTSYSTINAENDVSPHIHTSGPYVRVVKRRSTANKKERRRTQSINNAYADLRDCIPNVPADTKLSKIKTLRLATSYISYLTRALESDDPAGGFKAELGTMSRKSNNNPVQVNNCSVGQVSPKSVNSEDMGNSRKAKGRTGWPQHVWALELKQEQAL
uniref:Hand n=1 Tax=Leptinotarsa decemlineata TaxID=7539 RepID=A0A0F7DCF9_LEPDE|nr:hand [Leptinotarsa decemlineata]